MISKTERIHAYSPLRYPGGKTSLLAFLKRLIRENELTDLTYVEPFAGGAGAALGLLISGNVRRVVINDLDPAISAFWTAVIDDNQKFASKVRTVELNVNEWRKQKKIYTNPSSHSTFALGFSTFYLNRTNRSGVLNAGPIGGMDQTGNYKIDARFNREALLEKLRLIELYRRRISLASEDGIDIIENYRDREDVLIYADPPYFEKGASLYLNAFDVAAHSRLANALNDSADARWVLTYDDVPAIRSLYPDRRKLKFGLNYSVREKRRANELMVFSDRLTAPRTESSWKL